MTLTLVSAYCELLHFIVNCLEEYVNVLTANFKIFDNKIGSDQENCWSFFVC